MELPFFTRGSIATLLASVIPQKTGTDESATVGWGHAPQTRRRHPLRWVLRRADLGRTDPRADADAGRRVLAAGRIHLARPGCRPRHLGAETGRRALPAEAGPFE